jgi:hypothetical protein
MFSRNYNKLFMLIIKVNINDIIDKNIDIYIIYIMKYLVNKFYYKYLKTLLNDDVFIFHYNNMKK